MPYKHYSYFIDPPNMMQFACFDCRKSFKQRLSFSRQANKFLTCPECGKAMWEMGRQFKAPKQSDVKQWRKVEFLVRKGITFHTQRNYKFRNMPKVLREVVPFVQRVKRGEMSEGEKLLDKIAQRRKKNFVSE
jgi:predicted RNA-binding Zn-ribbon protein involved in translation (DUF1610 family)